MLWVEAVSVSTIAVVLAILLFRHGPHIDAPQLALTHVTASGIRLGVVLSIFSFVGFESATTLAILLVIIGTIYPPPTDHPYDILPYIYLAYLAVGLVWFSIAHRRGTAA